MGWTILSKLMQVSSMDGDDDTETSSQGQWKRSTWVNVSLKKTRINILLPITWTGKSDVKWVECMPKNHPGMGNIFLFHLSCVPKVCRQRMAFGICLQNTLLFKNICLICDQRCLITCTDPIWILNCKLYFQSQALVQG